METIQGHIICHHEMVTQDFSVTKLPNMSKVLLRTFDSKSTSLQHQRPSKNFTHSYTTQI